MKKALFLLTCIYSSLLCADAKTFSRDRMETFYNEFLLEQKDILLAAGLSGESSFSPPPNPVAPPFKTDLLPVVLVNNTGYPDDQVYVVITGKNYASSVSQVWGNINLSSGSNFGVMTLQPVAPGENSTTYSYALSSLPSTTGGYVFYSPQIQSGIIWFSIGQKLSMSVDNSSSIVQPNFVNPSDPNYYTNFDIFEFTRDQTNQVYADATAVSFFSLPLYGYLSGATSTSSNTGLYQPRSYIMSQAAATLSTAIGSAKSRWESLFLKSGSTILRLASPGKAISANLFDANYLDDASSYGYSYLNDIWTGSDSFYRNNTLSMSVTVTNPSTETYTYSGEVTMSNTFRFTSSNGGPLVIFTAPVTSPTPTGTTTFDIFSALNLTGTTPAAGTAADAVSKLFEEAVIAGLLPTTNQLSLSYLSSNQGNFYTVNNNLSSSGQSSGPWYDLYSKSLHALGSIYTYGFDEPLWPQVLLQAPFVNNSTYLGITMGRAQ